MFAGLNISASGLTAEKKRLELIANNIANINTPQSAGSSLYQPQRLMTTPAEGEFGFYLAGFREVPDGGVRITGVAQENRPPRLVYDPGHPDADANGYVAYPDINLLDEMVSAMNASRAYESNLTAFNETKKLFNKALEIGK